MLTAQLTRTDTVSIYTTVTTFYTLCYKIKLNKKINVNLFHLHEDYTNSGVVTTKVVLNVK